MKKRVALDRLTAMTSSAGSYDWCNRFACCLDASAICTFVTCIYLLVSNL
jgi:hypothetical protein